MGCNSRNQGYGYSGESSNNDSATQTAESGSITYVGSAAPGALTSDAVWRIKRLTESTAGLIVEFADGDDAYNNIWDNVTTLSFS